MFQNFEMMRYGGWGIWFFPFMVWSLFWKGLALWRSAKGDEKYWFVALLLLNTAGILELVYLFIFAKDKLVIKSKSKKK